MLERPTVPVGVGAIVDVGVGAIVPVGSGVGVGVGLIKTETVIGEPETKLPEAGVTTVPSKRKNSNIGFG